MHSEIPPAANQNNRICKIAIASAQSVAMSKQRDNNVSKKDIFYFWALNVASAFMLSAAHNVLYFVLDIRAPVIHFLHHFFTFLFMLLLHKLGCIPRTKVELKPQDFALPVGLRVLETILSAIVHSGNRTGSLYLVRIFDFVFNLVIVLYGKTFLQSRGKLVPRAIHVIPLGIAVSLSWLEFGQMEYSAFSMICAPVLAAVRGLGVLAIQKTFIEQNQGHVEQFCLHYTGLVSAGLALPALISYLTSHMEVAASWESIDHVLMGLSFVFMAFNLYSELWLNLSVNVRVYATLDHTKYLGASIGQWLIQNMAHPNILAFGGKLFAVASLIRIIANM